MNNKNKQLLKDIVEYFKDGINYSLTNEIVKDEFTLSRKKSLNFTFLTIYNKNNESILALNINETIDINIKNKIETEYFLNVLNYNKFKSEFKNNNIKSKLKI